MFSSCDRSVTLSKVDVDGLVQNSVSLPTDFSNINDSILIKYLKNALEKYIIQDYIENSDSGLNWMKIVDNKILLNCHCLPNSNGDLDDPGTGKECSHGTNPWAENGRSAAVFYPDVPVLVGDVNKDGVDDYIMNYTIEGMGGGTMWINNNILIINNGIELQCIAKFQGNVKYHPVHSELESIGDEGIFTIDQNYDSDWKLTSTDTVLHKYIESFQVFEKIKSNESSVQIDNILSIYKNESVESDLQNEIISKGLSLLTELKYCQRASGSVWNGLSDKQRKVEIAMWDIEGKARSDERERMKIPTIYPDKEELLKAIEAAKAKIALPPAPAMPLAVNALQRSWIIDKATAKATAGCDAEAFFQKQNKKRKGAKRPHQSHLGSTGWASDDWFALVHTPIPMKKAL